MTVLKHSTSPKSSPGRKKKKYEFPFNFQNIKASKDFQVSIKDVKVHSGQRFDICKESSCTCESLGYTYEWKTTTYCENENLYTYKTT
jgi:hypothetical protein